MPGNPRCLRVLEWNIQQGKNEHGICSLERQGELIASLKPQVVVLLEATKRGSDIPGNLRQYLQMRTERDWGFAYNKADADTGGNLILTKYPMVNYLVDEFVRASIVVGSAMLDVVALHLHWSSVEVRNRQVRALKACAFELGPNQIIAGDFNMEPDDASWVFWDKDRTDVWRAVHGSDAGYTKNRRTVTGGRPGRIDYQFFASRDNEVTLQDCQVVETRLSDHHVLVADYLVVSDR